ncbi:MAG: hypothetical protein NZL95_02230 [Chitinophagales bacterium]|nr:hypothetical protein [Chitinophagales bacterium]MDW8427352.1 hypothetical protein [Chitinophagales bacterium]
MPLFAADLDAQCAQVQARLDELTFELNRLASEKGELARKLSKIKVPALPEANDHKGLSLPSCPSGSMHALADHADVVCALRDRVRQTLQRLNQCIEYLEQAYNSNQGV